MAKQLITMLITVIYLTESAGINRIPLAVQYRKDCLRPLSALRSGKSHKNPVSPVNNVALDLAPASFDTVAVHQIYERLGTWKAQGRPVSLKLAHRESLAQKRAKRREEQLTLGKGPSSNFGPAS